MERINDINIQEAIIHVLEQGAEKPLLNESLLDLSEKTYQFIYKHIEKCLKDEKLKTAKFKDGDNKNTLNKVSREYLSGKRDNIISLSQDIAKNLFGIMYSNPNIPSCDLLVASIFTDIGPVIAVLKMDYVSSFTHSVNLVDDKVGIDIVTHKASLPGSTKKIEKAVFIRHETCDHDMMILDIVRTRKDEEYGANFFTETFAGAEVIDNERDITKRLVMGTELWTRSNLEQNVVMAEKVRTAIRKIAKEEDVVNVEELAEELFGNDIALKEDFSEYLEKHNIVDEVVIDKKWAEKKLDKIKLSIDRDIKLSISEEAYSDPSRFQIVTNEDGSINMVIKNVTNYVVE